MAPGGPRHYIRAGGNSNFAFALSSHPFVCAAPRLFETRCTHMRPPRRDARKRDNRGRAVDAQSKALATQQGPDREPLDTPRVLRKRDANGRTATADSVDEASPANTQDPEEDDARAVPSSHPKERDSGSHVMTTRSKALILLVPNKTPTKKPVLYVPRRPKAIGHITPQRNIIKGDPRPRVEDLEKVAPAGARCGVTKRNNRLKSIQISHAADRGTCGADLLLLEVMLGMEYKKLNLDTRPNLIFLTVEIHSAYDHGFCVILPMLSTLSILSQAIKRQEVKGWTRKKPPVRNAQGYIHHEDVFPFTLAGRKFRFVPLLSWDGDQPSIQCWTDHADGTVTRTTYDPPFTTPTGQAVLPVLTLHCCPYFVVWKAFKILSKPGAQVPEYALQEAKLVLKIGAMMTENFAAAADAADPGDNLEPRSSPSAYEPPSSPIKRTRASAR